VSPTFASLSVRNYRWWWTGALLSNIGTWMGRVAQDWLVLTQLTDHSASALGVVTGLQFLPFLLLAPFAGALVDRVDSRRLLAVTQTLLGLTSLLLGILTMTGHITLLLVYALAFVQGLVTAVDNPARQVFVSEVVPRRHLPNAVALNSASFNGARLIGPGVAGLLIAWVTTGPVFLVNAATFAFTLVALARLDTSELRPTPRNEKNRSVRDGLRYVRARRDIQLILVLVFVLGTFGMNFQMTTALMATRVFGMGSGEYGLLGSIMAIGSLVGTLLSARRPEPRLRVLLTALVGFVVATAAASLAPTYLLFAVALVPIGLSALTAMTTANAMVQLRVDPAMRGRVMALYMAIFAGGTPVGAPLIGWIGDAFGARWTIAIGSIAVGLTLAVVSVWLARHENVRVSYESRRRPRVRISVEGAPEAVR
jgi:MFS family permease